MNECNYTHTPIKSAVNECDHIHDLERFNIQNDVIIIKYVISLTPIQMHNFGKFPVDSSCGNLLRSKTVGGIIKVC